MNTLKKIGHAIEDSKRDFEQIFNLRPFDTKLEFSEFKYALDVECGEDVARIAEDPKQMTLVRNFLLQEADIDQLINIKFLKSHLFPPEEDNPEPKTKWNCISDFIEFLQKTPNINIEHEFKGGISHEAFEKILDSYDYKILNDNMEKLKESFTDPKEPELISYPLMLKNFNMLAPSLLNKDVKLDQHDISNKLRAVDPKVKSTILRISSYLKDKRIDTMTFFDECDKDGDGVVDEEEFVSCIKKWKIPTIKDKHSREAFKVMDINEDNTLSIGEILMFIQGVEPTLAERSAAIEKEIEKDMDEQITALFNEFKSDGKVTIDSLRRMLSAYSVPSNTISQTIAKVKTDDQGQVTKKRFKRFMMDFLKEHILEAENDINELRALFYEADYNKNGSLDMDELYNFFKLKLKANITKEELRQLVFETDLDYNGEIDIDEFIELMTKNPRDKGSTSTAQATYLRLKKTRHFDMTDFIKFLKKFPDHFEESFTTRLYRNKKHLPSCVYHHHIIPYGEDNLSSKLDINPTIKPSEPILAAQISLEQAKGVPFPEESKVEQSSILKRVVRVSIYNFDKNKFLANSTFVVAKCKSKSLDEWKFNKWTDTGTNPILFRTSELDYKEKNIHLVFEFVIYCKMDKRHTQELNCGWASLKASELEKKSGRITLDIVGGSPEYQNEMSYMDKNKKKQTGKSKLVINFRGLKDFSSKTRVHFTLLPPTCLLHKRMVNFLTGFRNCLGRDRFSHLSSTEDSSAVSGNNFMLVTLPKILDNPDFAEYFLENWNDSVIKKMKEKDLLDIDKMISKVEEYMSKLYPVAFSTDFKCGEDNVELAAECYPNHEDLSSIRRSMVYNAFHDRELNIMYKEKDKKIKLKNTYKPFNIRELEVGQLVYEDDYSDDMD